MAAPSPKELPEGVLPNEITEEEQALEEAARNRLRAVPDPDPLKPLKGLRGEFERWRSLLLQLASFYQGALEHLNEIELIASVTRHAWRALHREAFGDGGLAEIAKEHLSYEDSLENVQGLQRQVEKLTRGAWGDLDNALSTARRVTPAFWRWVVLHPKADAVETDKQQRPHTEATGRVKRCLFAYSVKFSSTVENLFELLDLVLHPEDEA